VATFEAIEAAVTDEVESAAEQALARREVAMPEPGTAALDDAPERDRQPGLAARLARASR
jgi:hypothetical protein